MYLLYSLIEKLPDLIISAFGTFMGVIGGWFFSSKIAKWQIKKQNEILKDNDMKTLRYKVNYVAIELKDNIFEVKELIKVLSLSESSRNDKWEWCEKIVDSMGFKSYENLVNSGLNTYLTQEINSQLHKAYKTLDFILYTVKKYKMAHSFYYGYMGSSTEANKLQGDLLSLANTNFQVLNEILKYLKSYLKKEFDLSID